MKRGQRRSMSRRRPPRASVARGQYHTYSSRRERALTWNLRTSAPEYANINHTSTKRPIAAATLEMISERLAKPSTLRRVPGEKPNTVVSTLWGHHHQITQQNKQHSGRYLRGNGKELEWKVSFKVSEGERPGLLMHRYSTTRISASQ